MSCVLEKAGDAKSWVARAHMGSACVALLGEGPGPDEDIIQPALHKRRGRWGQVQIVRIEI